MSQICIHQIQGSAKISFTADMVNNELNQFQAGIQCTRTGWCKNHAALNTCGGRCANQAVHGRSMMDPLLQEMLNPSIDTIMSQFMAVMNPNTDFPVAQDIHSSLAINTATNTTTAAITDEPIRTKAASRSC